MNRYLAASLGIASASLLLFFLFSVFLFGRNLDQVRKKSERRMSDLAAFIGRHYIDERYIGELNAEETAFARPRAPGDESGQWLTRLAQAAGLERAVITDSTGRVMASSQVIILPGENIAPYLVDRNGFARARKERKPFLTPLIRLEDVFFQSLYHPFDAPEGIHMVVLETDQNYMAQFNQFKMNVLWVSVALGALFAALAGALWVLARKAAVALSQSRRNEHMAFLGRTSAELAHELKNPLGIIKSSCDVLRRQFDPERKHPVFTFLSDETMRLSRLIGNILGFSRERPLEDVRFFPAIVLLELKERCGPSWPDVSWKIKCHGALSLIGDADAFRIVCDNLARNACQAMEGTGSISISLRKEKRHGLLLISDTGPGIPSALAKRIFEPFITGSRIGTGLGLSIVKTLCERCGWKVALLSNRAAGMDSTCFGIEFPSEKIKVEHSQSMESKTDGIRAEDMQAEEKWPRS